MRTQDHSPPAGTVLFHIGWSMSTIIIYTYLCPPTPPSLAKEVLVRIRMRRRDVSTVNGERAKGWANNGFVPSSSSSAE